MELNKWEKEFKEQLNSREISPSEKSWAKLDTMLSAAEKPKKKFRWMHVAASLVGLLLIGTIYFSQKSSINDVENNEVVIQDTIVRKNNKKPSDILNAKVSQIDNKAVSVVMKKSEKAFGDKEIRNESIIIKDSSNQNQEVVLINNKSKEDDVLVNSSENKNYQVTTKNKYISAEKLLAEVSDAEFETKITNQKNEETRKAITINPNDLLRNAENELNQSYRESALDRFNKKINAVKTVLVNRNYKE